MCLLIHYSLCLAYSGPIPLRGCAALGASTPYSHWCVPISGWTWCCSASSDRTPARLYKEYPPELATTLFELFPLSSSVNRFLCPLCVVCVRSSWLTIQLLMLASCRNQLPAAERLESFGIVSAQFSFAHTPVYISMYHHGGYPSRKQFYVTSFGL
jgi:hypothetical protein